MVPTFEGGHFVFMQMTRIIIYYNVCYNRFFYTSIYRISFVYYVQIEACYLVVVFHCESKDFMLLIKIIYYFFNVILFLLYIMQLSSPYLTHRIIVLFSVL
jgi:hypothetical protein